jgi:endonuclease YncB( thermonuclease family)
MMLISAISSFCIAAVLRLCVGRTAYAEPTDEAVITGVGKAKDGDAIWVGAGRASVEVRLHGIDTPEPEQQCMGAFPDGQSALNLAAARLRHVAGTAWSTKRYLNVELLKDQQMRGAITA